MKSSIKHIIFFIFMALACAAAVSFWPCLKFFGVAPDAALGVLAAYAALGGEGKTATLGLFAGLLLDAQGGGYFMFLGALLYFLAGWGLGRLQVLPLYHGFWLDTAACAIAYLLMQLVYMLVTAISGVSISAGAIFLQKLLPGMAYTVLIMAPVYFLFRWIDGLFDGRRKGPQRLTF